MIIRYLVPEGKGPEYHMVEWKVFIAGTTIVIWGSIPRNNN